MSTITRRTFMGLAAAAVATTRVNIPSSATSTFNIWARVAPDLPLSFSLDSGRRVHNRTLLLSGSPDATPSGKRSRRSRQAMCDSVPNGLLQDAVAPTAAASPMKVRLVMAGQEPAEKAWEYSAVG